jgi:hypothetical protein
LALIKDFIHFFGAAAPQNTHLSNIFQAWLLFLENAFLSHTFAAAMQITKHIKRTKKHFSNREGA